MLGGSNSPSQHKSPWLPRRGVGRLWKAQTGSALQEVRKLVKVHGRVFMRWLLHGEGLQSPSLTESPEEGQHPWKALNSDLLWPRQSRGLKLTLVM